MSVGTFYYQSIEARLFENLKTVDKRVHITQKLQTQKNVK